MKYKKTSKSSSSKKTLVIEPNTKALHKRTWNIFSKYIRKSSADYSGYASCYTCYKKYPWQEMNASHYFHRRLDFDERNIKACCVKCNQYLHGNLGNYATRLISEHGIEFIEQLKRDANSHSGYTFTELKEIHSKYTILFKGLNN